MAPQRFGEKVTYQSIRKLSENCNLFSSGSEQEFSATKTENGILTKTADTYMDIYGHEFIKARLNLRGVYDSSNTEKSLQVQTCSNKVNYLQSKEIWRYL